MAKKVLNNTICENARCPTGREDIFDALCPGLCLRVTANKKTWTFFYSPPGSKERARLALGSFPATGLGDARKRAEAARGQVEAGVDPRTIVDKPAGMTMAQLAQLYKDKHLCPAGRPALRSWKETMRRFTVDVIPHVGNTLVADFRKKHWYDVQDPMETRQVFVACNRTFEDLRRMMKFAATRDLCEFNPLASLEVPFPDEETTGSRFLSTEEIRHLWHSMPKALIRSPLVQLIVKLALATGKRSNEICGARRCEIDWAERIWTIPKERVKGTDRVKGNEQAAKDEKVPLSDLALELLLEASRRSNSEWLFPDDDKDGPYQPGVVSKCIRLALETTDDLPLGRLGMAKWTPHDLRRTVGTQMLNRANGLGITKSQKYLALNHKTPDADDKEERNEVSDRVYDMNDYADEKREALEKWGTFLSQLVGAETDQKVAA